MCSDAVNLLLSAFKQCGESNLAICDVLKPIIVQDKCLYKLVTSSPPHTFFRGS